jgi:uncharacterized protein YjbI with pentapeptide repeats
LTNCRLDGATLTECFFGGATLTECSFVDGATLTGSGFQEAGLEGSVFDRVKWDPGRPVGWPPDFDAPQNMWEDEVQSSDSQA